MKTITDSLNNLLETLSQQGDSSAFHSLCEPYLRTRYQKERNAGISHRDATIRVLAEATELFESFIAVSPRQRSAWIDGHCTIADNSSTDSEEVLLDTKIVAETAQFLRICSTELMKTASHIRKSQFKRRKNLFYRLTHNRLILPVGIPLLGILIIGLIVTIMYATGTVLSLTLSIKDNSFSFRIPAVKRTIEPEPLLSHLPLIIDTTNMTSDTSDYQETADTIPPPEEKPAPKPPKVRKPRISTPRVVPEKRTAKPVVKPVVKPVAPPAPDPEPVPPPPPPQTPAPAASPAPSEPTPAPDLSPSAPPAPQSSVSEPIITPGAPSQPDSQPENNEF